MHLIFSFCIIALIFLQKGCDSDLRPISVQFEAPWSDSSFQATDCSLWNDKDTLYFHFNVEDSMLVSVIKDNFHDGIGTSDRIEIFFSVDSNISRYYGMELCYDQRILDFVSTPYRQIDYTWTWPIDQIHTSCILTSNGYACDGSINLDYLRSLGILTGDGIYIGVFRADYNDPYDPKEVTWITAKNPHISKPDFHIPEVFFKYSLLQKN